MTRKPFMCAIILILFALALTAAFSGEPTPQGEKTEEKMEEKGKEESSESFPQEEKEKIDLEEVLEGTSGVRVQTMCTNCNVANVTMCGQTGDRVQVWTDGLPVIGGLGAIYLLSIMPSQGIASTEIIRGPGTVLSGSEAGVGAVLIETRAPEKKPYLFASLDAGTLNWSSQKLLGSGKLGRFGGELVFTNSRSDGSDPNGDGHFDLGSFDRTTLGTTLTYDIFLRSHLRVDAIRYREEQRDAKGGNKSFNPEILGEFYREDVDIRRDEYSLGWDYEFTDHSLLTASFRSTYREQDTSDDSGKKNPYMLVNETARASEVRYEKTFFNRLVFTGGALYRNFNVHGTTVANPPTFPTGQDIDDLIRQRGIYAQVDLPLPEHFNLTVGLRYDDFHLHSKEQALLLGFLPLEPRVNDKSEYLPRLRLAWKPVQMLALSLSAGKSFLPPRPFFERVCCGATILLNPDIEPLSSTDFLLDAELIPRPWVKVRVSAFRSDMDNYIQKMPWFSFGYVPSFTQFNYDEVTLEGGELSTEWRFFDRLTAGWEWSHVKAESENPELQLFGGPWFNLPPGQIPYLPKDQGSASVRWDDKKRAFQISAQAQYTGSLIMQKLENFYGLADVFVETPDFWIFNFRIQGRIYQNLSLFAGMDNITDEYQLWLDDPRYEYNWGPLRGRYIYAGISFEL